MDLGQNIGGKHWLSYWWYLPSVPASACILNAGKEIIMLQIVLILC